MLAAEAALLWCDSGGPPEGGRTRVRGQTREPCGLAHAYELGYGADLHLLHHAAAVLLDRLLRNVEIGGDLLVQPALDHVLHDLALASRQSLHPCHADVTLERPSPLVGMTLQGPTDSSNEDV